MTPMPPAGPSYERAEIVEDRDRNKLLSYLFAGAKKVKCHDWDLRWNYADADRDDMYKELVSTYKVPPDQISQQVVGGTSQRRPKSRRRPSRGSSRR